MNKKTLFITQAAVIAALYVVLTYVSNAFGLASGAIQVRLSEALTVLPFFTPAAIPGLFIGCILANTLTGCMILDTVFGSIATLAGALGSYAIARSLKHNNASKFLVSLPPIIANTIIVPLVIKYVYQSEGTIPYFMLTVGIGEVIACGIIGHLVLRALSLRARQIFHMDED